MKSTIILGVPPMAMGLPPFAAHFSMSFCIPGNTDRKLLTGGSSFANLGTELCSSISGRKWGEIIMAIEKMIENNRIMADFWSFWGENLRHTQSNRRYSEENWGLSMRGSTKSKWRILEFAWKPIELETRIEGVCKWECRPGIAT